MHFSYNKLFKLMIDRNIKKKELSEMSDVSETGQRRKREHGRSASHMQRLEL